MPIFGLGSINRLLPTGSYVDVVNGMNPFAYWRLAEVSGTTMVDSKGLRHGTYSGGVILNQPPLMQGGEAAADFAGAGSATVLHDSGFSLPAFSLLVWFRLHSLPPEGEFYTVFAKDQPGLNLGDFQILMTFDGEGNIQFQDASQNIRIGMSLEIETTYVLIVRADLSGFDAYLNGAYLGKNTGWADAWASNSNNLVFAASQTHATVGDMVIDDVAIFNRVLSEAEVFALSQATSAPVAAGDNFVVPESATSILDVTANDTFVGQKSALSIDVLSQPDHGTVTVRGDRDLDFEADAVTQDEADGFTYRITDPNGTSNVASVGVTVQNAASQGGGTLVYDWQPQASWIDGVPLTSRDEDNINGNQTWWRAPGNGGGASVGGSLVQGVFGPDGSANWAYCWNRAPTGHPSLEAYTIPNGVAGSVIVSAGPQLYAEMQGEPRHLRVVFEIKTSKTSDPTTFKSQGKGPTTGSYTNWADTVGGVGAACKYWVGIIAGRVTGPHGGCRANWWNDASSATEFRPDRFSSRIQGGPSGKAFASYVYHYDRPGACGAALQPTPNWRYVDSGILGVWHRVELEMRLNSAASCPSNAVQQNPGIEPSHTGDGFVKIYVTKDIDGELGTPGVRTQVVNHTGLLFTCRSSTLYSGVNNMHQVCNLLGPWVNFYYGGSTGSQGQGWSWLRRIQVYRHD